MTKCTCCLIILFLFYNISFVKAQADLDSLLNLWQNKEEVDTVRLAAIDQLISANNFELFEEHPDSVIALTNELIANSLKYAFNEEDCCKISIAMNKDENNLIQFIIADIGRNEFTRISEGGTGFGSILINLLTTQLGGHLKQITEQGTATIIKFPMHKKTA